MVRRALAVAALALATAAPAGAHAIPLHAEPPSGSTLVTPPTAVFVTFDSPVRVGPRNAAVRNDGTSVLAGKPRVLPGNRLELPLRPGLGTGEYSVRWSIVSDDGHEEEGVLAFGIGTSGSPVSVLTTRGYVTWQRILMRALFIIGVLGAAGAAFFSLFVLGGALPRRQAHLLFGCFLLAFAGADALIHETSASGTRFEHVMIAAAVIAGIGAAASALAPLRAWLRYLVWAAAGALALCPTFAGHAFDPGQPTVIAPLADLLHLGGAAVWIGGVASLALARTGTVQRFAQFALPAVLVVAIGGAARALTELSSFSQIWTTSYGRTLIVKTAIFAALLLLVWLAHRRQLYVQLALLVVLATTVAVLTDLRPARAHTSTITVPLVPADPPVGAYVDAAQAGPLAVGFAWLAGRGTVTVVSPDGSGANGLDVTIDGATAESCGEGCYAGRAFRQATVDVAGTSLHFSVPAELHPAGQVVALAKRLYDSSAAVSIHERLFSRPGVGQVTDYHERAPDKVAYRIVASSSKPVVGEQVVVIGTTRWQRVRGGRWEASPQGVLRVPRTYWAAARNAYSEHGEVTFYDPLQRAWFRVRLDESGRPVELWMIAGAHFMHHDYSFRSAPISPPAR